jgi:hypothetical protein
MKHNNYDSYSAGVNSHDSDEVADSKVNAYYSQQNAHIRLRNHQARIASLSPEDYRTYAKIRNGIVIAMAVGAAGFVAYCNWFY